MYSAWHPGDLYGKVSDFPLPGSWLERACIPGAARMPEQELAAESSFGEQLQQPALPAWRAGASARDGCPEVAARGGCLVLVVAIVFLEAHLGFYFSAVSSRIKK